MIRVFITGATGFAGRHLINALNSEGAGAFDIFGTSFPQEPEPGGKIIFLDIRSRQNVTDILRYIKPDWIFHLAAMSSVRRSWENSYETLEINLLGTHNLLEAAKSFARKARILFVSSSEIYKFENKKNLLANENTEVEILSPYAFSKFAAEQLCEFNVRTENLDIVIARPFHHTGPGQSEDFVCSDWAKQIVEIERGKKNPVIKVGNLAVMRDFCDVRDVVRAYVMLMRKGKKGQIYNVCSGKPISLRKILTFLVKEADLSKTVSIEIDPDRLRKTDSAFKAGDRTKLTKETGWEPEIQIERSLRDLLNYWRKECRADI